MVVCASNKLLQCSLFNSVNSPLALLTAVDERARSGIYQRLEPVKKSPASPATMLLYIQSRSLNRSSLCRQKTTFIMANLG